MGLFTALFWRRDDDQPPGYVAEDDDCEACPGDGLADCDCLALGHYRTPDPNCAICGGCGRMRCSCPAGDEYASVRFDEPDDDFTVTFDGDGTSDLFEGLIDYDCWECHDSRVQECRVCYGTGAVRGRTCGTCHGVAITACMSCVRSR